MLSQELRTLCGHLREKSGRRGGVYLTPEEVVAMVGILTAVAEGVRGLERQPVPAVCRDPLPPGVADLMAHRARENQWVGRGLPEGGLAG